MELADFAAALDVLAAAIDGIAAGLPSDGQSAAWRAGLNRRANTPIE